MTITFAAVIGKNKPPCERSPLQTKTSFRKFQQRYSTSRKCISSKAALLVLLWSFIVSLASSFIFFSNLPLHDVLDHSFQVIIGCVAAIYLFYPLAGHLADTKFGRYKTVIMSVRITSCGLIAALVGVVALFLSLVLKEHLATSFKILVSLGLTVLIVGVLLLLTSNISFCANALQFGLDQLYDSPAEDQSVFIHWYLWTSNLGVLIATVVLYNVSGKFQTLLLLKCILLGLVALALPLLLISLYIASRKKNWFLIEPCRSSPYRLVYKISKFACQHKVPVHRSAFTYCEDEIPTGLDLGKTKYGGPFTTEQVENVKAFYGILRVLFALGPVFFLLISSEPGFLFTPEQNQTVTSPYNITGIKINKAQEIFLQNVVLISLVACVCIPLHLLLFRPFLKNHTPGMLRRIGLGAISLLFCEIVALIVHTVAYMKHIDLGFMYNIYTSSAPLTTNGSTYLITLLIARQVLAALAILIFEIALFEFICSQSPTSMKGLLIGLSFSIRGTFFILSVILDVILDNTMVKNDHFIDYSTVRQLITIAVGIGAVLVYIPSAQTYKYRERDEPCHVQRYVEDYYSKLQQENLYDYSE